MKKKWMAMVFITTLMVGIWGNAFKPVVAEAGNLVKVKTTNSKVWTTQKSYDAKDNIEYVLETGESSKLPYYVGKQKSSFLKKNEGKYDRVLYLNTPMYIPSHFKNGVYFKIADESILQIEKNTLVGKKQGITKLEVYDANKKKISAENILVTTYNDGKDIIQARSFAEDEKEIWNWDFLRNGAQWKEMVKTINDASFFFQATNFIYSSEGECQLPFVEDWQFTMYGEDCALQRKGVCLQAAQTAVYLLEDDFEEAGVIYTFGNAGHIFNWFYEDGSYYVMDFTEVISDNTWGRANGDYIDYSKKIYRFKSLDKLKKWIVNEKGDISRNYCVIMLSCMGYDYIPAWRDGGCGDSAGAMNGAYHVELQWEDIVVKHPSFKVLYLKKAADVEVSGVSVSEVPKELFFMEHVLYTPHKQEYKWYYQYE